MKKLLIALPAVAVLGYLSVSGAFAAPGFPTGTDNATRSFAPIQQRQFEKEETLDFVNQPEQYKERRDKKNKYLDYQEGKVDVLPSVKTQYNTTNSRPGTSNLQFVKDENGRIKIKSVQ